MTVEFTSTDIAIMRGWGETYCNVNGYGPVARVVFDKLNRLSEELRERKTDFAASPPEKIALDALAVVQENIVILQNDVEALSEKLYLLLDVLNQKSILTTPVINMIREAGEDN